MRMVCALGLLLALLQLSTALLLAAFNIQSFGKTKASDQTVMNHITEIVRRYDIILIQEVRGSDLSATHTLMNYVNSGSPIKYKYIVSDPLGSSTYKERYLFLYRETTVSVEKSYLYDDTSSAFSRSPFIVMFSSKLTAMQDFVLIPQHTCPKKAVAEINALYDVVQDVWIKWKTKNIMLLGDFNAGCTYVGGSDWTNIRLFTDKSFHWLITNAVDTTVSHRNCPYDRIVVTNDMMKQVIANSARVYDYETTFHLSKSEASDISDHFPVEVQLT